jgi:hypothetical protein
VEPLIRGLPPPDPHSLCSLSSTEFVELPPKKLLGTPLLAIVVNIFIINFVLQFVIPTVTYAVK